jgi:lipopolysaccharide biosynthesis glycosyltransferase
MAKDVWRKTLNEEIEPLRIFIGWDSREDIAYQVAKLSIEQHASVPVEIVPLKQHQLREQELYWRDVDKLASTEFTYTRYLIPELCEFKGWALFIDCDFVFRCDVKEIFDQLDDRYAIMCAQHDYTPAEGVKMDGQQQTVYPRKNWSSMMLINCGHPSNRVLIKEVVNSPRRSGAFFHRFTWLKDEEIGQLSHEYNWLVGWYQEPRDGNPKVLHYTEGGPWFTEYEECEYAVDWYRVYKSYTQNKESSKKTKSQKIDIDQLDLIDQKKKLIKEFLNTVVDERELYYKDSKKFIKESKVMGEKVAAIFNTDLAYNSSSKVYDEYLQSFIMGTNGYLSNWRIEKNTNNPLVIRGVSTTSQNAIRHCWKNSRTFYAIDTGYWGNKKHKQWHRITKNNLQLMGPIVDRPSDRLKKIGYSYNKFTTGRKILICPPSEKIMTLFDQTTPERWVNQIVTELKNYTDRPIEIRLKPNRTDRTTVNTIENALADDVYCLITYNSIAAIEALMFGKPAITLGPNSAQLLCNTNLSEIENLNIPSKDQMYQFMCYLSYGQFTKEEMLNGTAWRILNESS